MLGFAGLSPGLTDFGDRIGQPRRPHHGRQLRRMVRLRRGGDPGIQKRAHLLDHDRGSFARRRRSPRHGGRARQGPRPGQTAGDARSGRLPGCVQERTALGEYPSRCRRGPFLDDRSPCRRIEQLCAGRQAASACAAPMRAPARRSSPTTISPTAASTDPARNAPVQNLRRRLPKRRKRALCRTPGSRRAAGTSSNAASSHQAVRRLRFSRRPRRLDQAEAQGQEKARGKARAHPHHPHGAQARRGTQRRRLAFLGDPRPDRGAASASSTSARSPTKTAFTAAAWCSTANWCWSSRARARPSRAGAISRRKTPRAICRGQLRALPACPSRCGANCSIWACCNAKTGQQA